MVFGSSGENSKFHYIYMYIIYTPVSEQRRDILYKMSSTPSPGMPNSPLQSEKAKRYDRQLRLWGDHGQVGFDCR